MIITIFLYISFPGVFYLKEKLYSYDDLEIAQDSWADSPCSFCHETPCCSELPLSPFRLTSRFDFIQLCLLSCYKDIHICLKERFEWSVYLQRPCRFRQNEEGKCSIHGLACQSMICKSYDAHKCWYREAFDGTENMKLIQFDFSRLMWLGEHYDFFGPGIHESSIDWKELISEISYVPYIRKESFLDPPAPENPLLPFTDCSADKYLFFPLQHRPDRKLQFELFRFRLGFPGMYLAVSDNCWCYMLKTEIDTAKLGRLQEKHFPAIAPAHNPFGFDEMNKKAAFHSEMVPGFAIAGLMHLDILQKFSIHDERGRIRRVPSTREALKIIRSVNSRRPDKPDRAA